MWDLKSARLSGLLTFSDFTTAIRSMMSLNSSLYLAAETIFTFQVFIWNQLLGLFSLHRRTRLLVGGGAETSQPGLLKPSDNLSLGSKQRGADELMDQLIQISGVFTPGAGSHTHTLSLKSRAGRHDNAFLQP